ncbi:PdaC/SigV domain-containing protein [Bacillus massilinigeriensis]|uniref:PdaC/SigV domain-containing protein n=1 Tax=Bacillus massilionigeriensis TaxID=1805475 RepID=UPI00096B2A1E|nr:DUF4163 domain-containing protein [Bacillus massilionigeriensis]
MQLLKNSSTMFKSFMSIVLITSLFAVGHSVSANGSETNNQFMKAKATKIVQKRYKNISNLRYPQVSGLKSKTAEAKINITLLDSIKKSYKEYLALENFKKDFNGSTYGPGPEDLYHKTTYSVKFNDGKILSVLFKTDEFAAGARNHISLKSYNFNISSGKLISFDSIFSTDKKRKNLVNYIKSYNKKYKKFPGTLSYNNIKSMSVFVYTNSGISLNFQEYTAYMSSDMPIIKIPKSIYK